MLGEIQDELFQRAEKRFSLNSRQVQTWDDFVQGFGGEHADGNGIDFGGCLAPHCLDESCGCEIQALVADAGQKALDASRPSVKSVCIPWDQPEGIEKERCINPGCTNAEKNWALFGCEWT